MSAAKWLASLALGAVTVFASLYFSISLCVAFFKISGRLVEGQPMYFDLQTPTWPELLLFQLMCGAIMGIGLRLRRKLQVDHLYLEPTPVPVAARPVTPS